MRMPRLTAVSLLACCLFYETAIAAKPGVGASQDSISNTSFEWPAAEPFYRLITLQDYNTRIVLLGTTVLGCAAGMVGSFTLLRKRALMGDALSHATLPGIAFAFIIGTAAGWDGKSLPLLLTGATITGLLGVATILTIRNTTRLKDDTALGAVLSVFFGAGVALLGVVQQMKSGHAAGLEAFIYGKTASMRASDAVLIIVVAGIGISMSLLMFKELKLLCFDEKYGGASGYPILFLDVMLMALVVLVTIVGLQAVGLILMIALLIIPAAAARFWTERMWSMTCISGGLGMLSGLLGASFSALFSKLPSGAMIVLVCTLFFLLSMVFGTTRGILVRWLRRLQLNRSVDRQHLLRAIYEMQEPIAQSHDAPSTSDIKMDELLAKRSWSQKKLFHVITRNQRAGLVERNKNNVRLTQAGLEEAARLTRQHRLWELYLITHADIAPNRVDRDADAIEHVLEPELVAELESLLQKPYQDIPASPHEIEQPSAASHTHATGEGS